MKSITCDWTDDNHFMRYFELENRFLIESVSFSIPVVVIKMVNYFGCILIKM